MILGSGNELHSDIAMFLLLHLPLFLTETTLQVFDLFFITAKRTNITGLLICY